jgi:hypothetical protein
LTTSAYFCETFNGCTTVVPLTRTVYHPDSACAAGMCTT